MFFLGGGVATLASYSLAPLGLPLTFQVEMDLAIAASVLWILGITIAISGIIPPAIVPSAAVENPEKAPERIADVKKEGFADDRDLRPNLELDRDTRKSLAP